MYGKDIYKPLPLVFERVVLIDLGVYIKDIIKTVLLYLVVVAPIDGNIPPRCNNANIEENKHKRQVMILTCRRNTCNISQVSSNSRNRD